MITFERNYDNEQMRDRNSKPFEWYSASLPLISIHIHSKGNGWTWIIRGVNQYTRDGYATHQEAIDAAKENAISITKKLLKELE